MSLGFSRRLRLIKPSEFSSVYENAQRKKTPHFSLFLKSNVHGHPRLGLSISKKNVSKAVDRNRLKRIIRECFRKQQQQISNIDIIVVVYKSAQKASNTELNALLEKQWFTKKPLSTPK